MVIERFLAHHLSLDVQEIFLFFDNPTDLMAARLSKVPRLTIIKCDDAYWSARKDGRPNDHRQRQIYNANYASNRLSKSDWIANIDADEYLYPRSSDSISSLLSETPESFDAIRVLPAEHVFSDFPEPGSLHSDGKFKLKAKNRTEFSEIIFGDLAELFPSGFIGHEVGKSFKRRSVKAGGSFNVHFVRRDGSMVPTWLVPQEKAVLLHAFPSSYEDFKKKFERRLQSQSYMDGLRVAARLPFLAYGIQQKDNGEKGVESFFQRTSILPKETIDKLEAESLILDVDLLFEDKISKQINNFRKRIPFLHLSNPSCSTVLDEQKIFQIGMNRGGSKEICAELSQQGYSYCHWDEGHIARSLLDAKARGSKPFQEYSNYELLSDISISGQNLTYDGFLDVNYIFKFFPKAIYIANFRPVEDWIQSRSKFRGGKHLAEAKHFYGISTDEAVKELWRNQWNSHFRELRREARDNGLKLIEYPIYSAAPGYLVAEITRMRKEALNG